MLKRPFWSYLALSAVIIQVGRAAGIGTRERYLCQISHDEVRKAGWAQIHRNWSSVNKLGWTECCKPEELSISCSLLSRCGHRHSTNTITTGQYCSLWWGIQPIKNRAVHTRSHPWLRVLTLEEHRTRGRSRSRVSGPPPTSSPSRCSWPCTHSHPSPLNTSGPWCGQPAPWPSADNTSVYIQTALSCLVEAWQCQGASSTQCPQQQL